MQTEVLDNPPLGVAGQIADHHTAASGDVASAINEEASAEMLFGTMVAQGDSAKGAKLIAGTAAQAAPTLLGLVVHGHHYAQPLELGESGLKPGVTFGLGLRGRFFVRVEQDVAPGDDVRVRVVAAGAEVKGVFRATADSTDCVDLSALARWRSEGEAGGIAVLEIDMTNAALAVADA
jgi:hypothetical protein